MIEPQYPSASLLQSKGPPLMCPLVCQGGGWTLWNEINFSWSHRRAFWEEEEFGFSGDARANSFQLISARGTGRKIFCWSDGGAKGGLGLELEGMGIKLDMA